MDEPWHNQTPQYNVDPRSNGDFFGDLPRDLQRRYLAEIQAVGEKAWQTGEYCTNGQTVILNSKVRHQGPWVNHAHLNPDQFHLRQQHQQHQQYQQQEWQQIPPVSIVPQQRPAVCSAPSLGPNQFQTWALPQQPGWHFVKKPDHVDLTANHYDIGNHASSDFNNILTSQSTQQPEKLKSGMGHSVDCPVDLTRSHPPTYTTATASNSSTEGVGYHNQAPTSPLPETQTKHDASRGFVNVLDPKAYLSPFYHPRLQNGPQRYAARRMINQSDKHLRLISDLMKEEEEEEQEYGQENYRYESEDYEEDDSEHYNYEEEDYKQEKCPIVPRGTPPFSPPAFTSTANTPQRPEGKELDAILGMYENTWEYKSKPAITAALYKYKRTRLERSKYVLDCLMDMVQVNSDEFKPPTRPDKNNHNNNHNNHNNNDNNNHNNKMNDNNTTTTTTTTTTRRKKRDSSSSWDSSFDDEEEEDGCQSESSGNSKRLYLPR
ncbi:hypothetical protein QR685DRAFT_578933 [Neurospora intermedia]|uniref:Uncharacterized protein n=1 Tax=Neurospora intermedia TaxID=5142 RepID=A0ABR3DTE5_NEUIN